MNKLDNPNNGLFSRYEKAHTQMDGKENLAFKKNKTPYTYRSVDGIYIEVWMAYLQKWGLLSKILMKDNICPFKHVSSMSTSL